MQILKAKYNKDNTWITLTFDDNTTGQISNDNIRRKHTDLFNDWIKDSGVIEEYLTETELAASDNIKKLTEAHLYLDSTDKYFTIDKYKQLTDERKIELTEKRESARVAIRTFE